MRARPPRRVVVAAAVAVLSLVAAGGAAAGVDDTVAAPADDVSGAQLTGAEEKPPKQDKPPKDGVGGEEPTLPDAPTDTTTLDSVYVPGQVLVRYLSTTTATQQTLLEGSLQAVRLGEVAALSVQILRVPLGTEAAAVATLTTSGLVDYAERDGVVAGSAVPNDQMYAGYQWHLPKVNAPAAWDVTTGSTATTIAVLDTGVLATQPDLQGKLLAGYDFVNNDADPADDHGHGTAISGVVAAVTNNGEGVAGVCWQCKVMPVKVLGSTMQGSWSAVANGMTWAADRGVRIFNLSLAGGSSTTFDNAMAYVKARNGVVLAAAGNQGASTPTWPAAHADAVGVGGTDANDAKYSWSNFGTWVDLTAPGCTYTTRAGAYQSFCGTSAATPVVAGVVGLLLSAKPTLTAGEVISALYATTTASNGTASYGRVDAAAALRHVGAGSTTPPPSDPTPPPPAPTTTTQSFTGSASSGTKTATVNYSVTMPAGTLSASLQWSGAQPSLAIKKGKTTYASSATGNPVTLNVTGLAAGTYTLAVSVRGTASWTLTVTRPA